MSSGGPFSGASPRWFTVPAQRPLLTDLATGLLAALPGEALSEAVVLLPSRRSVRAMTEAFVAAGGGRALLLPQIRALGDLDEGEPPFEPGDLALDLPAAIEPYRRRFELAKLAADAGRLLGRSLDASGALEMADALGGFLDSLEIEEIPREGRLDRIASLVEGDLARHWQLSADVLAIAVKAWPRRLAELGLIDPAERRTRLLRALAESWTTNPPEGPIIAAGSTGAAPANAALLAVIAGLPKGAVVLPGLDQELADTAWDKVEDQHPQGAMKRMLDRADVPRSTVRVWPYSPDSTQGRWRRRIINEALRPAEETHDWVQQITNLQKEGDESGVEPFVEGLRGLSLLGTRDEEQAAATAALLLREALETPGRTAALITPDQGLARRVSARLSRWGVEVDSSAGVPLADAPIGVLIALVAKAALDPSDPVLLLAILKHPLVRLGMEPAAFDRAQGALERLGLRGPRREDDGWIETCLDRALRPRNDQTEVSPRQFEDVGAARSLLGLLRSALGLAGEAFRDGPALPQTAARGLVSALEVLAADAASEVGALWSGPDGEAAVELLAAMINEGSSLPPARPKDFANLVESLLNGAVVRATRSAHPRLKILGAIESRMVSADLLILAGLEEGVWPQGAPIDPFLSRPMRAALGLPPPERRIGLSAHDFAQAACAPEVVLMHSARRDGAPAVESRWLWRLRTLARGAQTVLPSRADVLGWAGLLDQPAPFAPAPRPRPRPPVEVRPKELPVTGVETWVRDPYATYARYVLRLRPMERPDEPVEARARGEAVHRALQRFAELHGGDLPEGAEATIETLLVEALTEAGMNRAAMARERPLARNAAPWIVALERGRRRGARLLVEQKGVLILELEGGAFTLTARADRLELRDAAADVLDFKTGAPPSRKQVQSDFAPQLTLTAAILQGGGFPGVGPLRAGELIYVQVSGRSNQPDPRALVAGDESAEWASRALEGLKRRIARFRSEAVEYVSWAAPQYMNERGGDYDHLARVWEWHVIGEAEEGGA